MPKRKDNQSAVMAIAKRVKSKPRRDELTAILEKIYDDYHVFGEQQDLMRGDIREIKQDVKTINQRLDRFLETRVTKLEKTVAR